METTQEVNTVREAKERLRQENARIRDRIEAHKKEIDFMSSVFLAHAVKEPRILQDPRVREYCMEATIKGKKE